MCRVITQMTRKEWFTIFICIVTVIISMELWRSEVPRQLLYTRSVKRYWQSDGETVLAGVLHEHGWERTEDMHTASLVYYVRRAHRLHDTEYIAGQAVNYVKGSDLLTRKHSLTERLRAYEAETGVPAAGFQPLTVLLANQTECTQFFHTPDNYQKVWLTKVTSSSRGRGIVIYPDLNVARRLYVNESTGMCHPHSDNVIMQQYLENPLLLEGKKSEMRSYWLIASVHPLLVLYHDGTVRRNTEDWRADDWDNPLIHIANTYQQKLADPNYHETAEQRKWSLEKMGLYVQNENMTPETQWVESTLKPRLKYMLAHVANSTATEWRTGSEHDGGFTLLGMDTILDADLRPWLTEIQVGPGVSLDSPTKRRIIPRMLREMVNIVLEVQWYRARNITMQTLGSVQYFEWLINEDAGFFWGQ